MSKPDPASGSLENILASIRKSLSEQSTDAASEDTAALAEGQEHSQGDLARGDRLAQRLAAHTGEVGQSKEPREDDLSHLIEGQVLGDMPVSPDPARDIVLPASRQPVDKDPLWFLSSQPEPEPGNRDEPAKTETPERSDLPVQAAVVAPKPQRPETVRASRPPFFGSSAEAGRPDGVVTTDSVSVGLMPPPEAEPQGVQLMPPAAPVSPPPPAREAPAVEEAPRIGGAIPQPATSPVVSSRRQGASTQIGSRATGPAMVPPFPPVVDAAPAEVHPPAPAMSMAASNDKSTSPSAEPPRAQASAPSPGGKAPSTHALEAMVVEMLQPMLRQWLDQNMPRLVAAALKDQAERLDASNRNANKT